MRIIFISILFSLFIGFTAKAQTRDTTDFMIGIVSHEDTVFRKEIKEIMVLPRKGYKGKKYVRTFWRLVRKVRKVYPYAEKINELLKQYEPEYLALESDKERRKLIKQVEKELMDQYKDELKKLTISEGRILIKLVDRETGRTGYSLIKDFRGGFKAFFWQSIARLFGNDLKAKYDPVGEDRMIEEIILMIETGKISL